MADEGRTEEGLKQMNHGIASWKATGAMHKLPYFNALLAETYGNIGQVKEGLQIIDNALSQLEKTGERWCEAEMCRLKGTLLFNSSKNMQREAEACFHKALRVARQQQAKLLELRAAKSLSLLWMNQGKRREAQTMLAEIYDWYTEGFDTVDLKEAKMLLEQMS
jgi:predicted ATPase